MMVGVDRDEERQRRKAANIREMEEQQRLYEELSREQRVRSASGADQDASGATGGAAGGATGGTRS